MYTAIPLVLVLATSRAIADPVAYVDEVVVVGGPDAARGRAHAAALVSRAGLRARFGTYATPCGDTAECLHARARRSGAVIALRLTIAEVGATTTVSLLAVDAGARLRRSIATVPDLDHVAEPQVLALRELVPVQRSKTRIVAWSSIGSGTAVAALGVYFVSRAQRGWRDIERLADDRGMWSEHYVKVEHDAHRDQWIGVPSVIAGTAGIVVGGVLLYLDRRGVREIAIVPTGDGARAFVSTRF